MNQTRRDFLRRAGVYVGSAAVASTIDNLTLTSALAGGPGYKALVCVFLTGGNDANNTIIPVDNGPEWYPLYAAARQGAGFALTQAQLAATTVTPPRIGLPFAFHPNLNSAFQTNRSIYGLWNYPGSSKVAVVCNVGPLVQPLVNPTPRAAYQQNPSLRPPSLFSHSDQIVLHQVGYASTAPQTGWGGRTADRFPPHPSGFPLLTSIAGAPRFTLGAVTQPLALSPAPAQITGVLTLTGYTPQFPTAEPERSRREAFDLLRTVDRGQTLVRAAGNAMDQAVEVARALSNNPVINTQFPNTPLGNQLLQVARVMRANLTLPALGLNRQIFFVSLGGFDTHGGQLNGQGNLLTQLSQAVGSFFRATEELNVADRVTTFTLSDFNRTFDPAGSGSGAGTDHAWGSHQLVIGGAVRGGDFYGVDTPNGTPYPVLYMGRNNPALAVQDADSRGRWVPSTSLEQYAATLAAWFGVSPQHLRELVFPWLTRFAPEDLGFMA